MDDDFQGIEEQEEQGVEEAVRASPVARLLPVVAVLVGGLLGFVVLGPMVTGGSGAGEAESGAATHEAATDDHEGGGSPSGTELFAVENLVVNPAGTEGVLRFLMVTVAVEPATAEALARLEGNEVVLRDALLRTFGLHTTDELLDMQARSHLIDEIRTVIEGVVGAGAVGRIFLPQYVIQ